MTPEGHQKITAALAEADIAARVHPVPQPGEDIRFLDIRTNSTENLAHVLNALGNAGLLHIGDQDPAFEIPELDFISSELRIVGGSEPRSPLSTSARFITFEDLAVTQ